MQMEPYLCLRAPVMRHCQHSVAGAECVSEGGFGLVATTAISNQHISCCFSLLLFVASVQYCHPVF
jgi:hypothetical protein